jgi:hypothetical protein
MEWEGIDYQPIPLYYLNNFMANQKNTLVILS